MELKKQIYNAILDQLLPGFIIVACIITRNRELKVKAKLQFNA